MSSTSSPTFLSAGGPLRVPLSRLGSFSTFARKPNAKRFKQKLMGRLIAVGPAEKSIRFRAYDKVRRFVKGNKSTENSSAPDASTVHHIIAPPNQSNIEVLPIAAEKSSADVKGKGVDRGLLCVQTPMSRICELPSPGPPPTDPLPPVPPSPLSLPILYEEKTDDNGNLPPRVRRSMDGAATRKRQRSFTESLGFKRARVEPASDFIPVPANVLPSSASMQELYDEIAEACFTRAVEEFFRDWKASEVYNFPLPRIAGGARKYVNAVAGPSRITLEHAA
ncbi:hypothetical protein BV25DRAFT_1915955 [Artomyces pyxidatus]|uniref:Uncharacterized protein n=1 Tax=Artomyces pyxidatus TaxID=48021 RepID=A0ACB8T2R5_9AGAM|nr:hypothetical protein BV25DRAFT_1915955 [Artomyces pyxidatus]